jgi:plasmid stabilization system protein ParE
MEVAQAPVEAMLDVVRGWREFFMQQGVEPRGLDMLAHAMLPGTHELIMAKTRYNAAYCVRGETVEILRVFHTSRRLPDRW